MRSSENTPEITPINKLFTYHIFGYPSVLKKWEKDISTYSLEIKGLVGSPKHYTLTQIRKIFKMVESEVILQCMTNIHWGRIIVTGVRLHDVLQDVLISQEAYKIAFYGAEGFTTDLLFMDIEREPNKYLLAYEMNHLPLEPNHGFPLRLIADGKYAYKWCK